jgi:hypothetical protein
MRVTRYYHLIEDIATGQIVIEKYATLTEKEALDGGEEMHERFANEHENTDKELHRLMSEGALDELRQQITRALRAT